jgi:preprotein translocase subunit YajC
MALLAQEQGKGPEQAPFLGNPLFLMVMLGLLFYFVMFKPAQRQKREQQAMLEAVKKNDEVVTAGGIIGTVVNIKKDKDEVTIESSNTRLRVLKSSIAKVLTSSPGSPDKDEESKDKDEEEKS